MYERNVYVGLCYAVGAEGMEDSGIGEVASPPVSFCRSGSLPTGERGTALEGYGDCRILLDFTWKVIASMSLLIMLSLIEKCGQQPAMALV
ncbi:hypothetical protein AXF42_Ash003781 [Apostasia shenzhenica]|uniref:Uncharacterized protein n=1 Tax=Apostasia shenzhenica TaxID=1088818 RepID=A0A2I0AHW0_9ASPA|nr:hypothetical protein AXF42_Ash003781 [Apostasia shenzhenica]